MAKPALRAKVIELRMAGMSYKDIRKIVKVSAGSLSLWLRTVELTNEQRAELQERKRSNQAAFAGRYARKGLAHDGCARGGQKVQLIHPEVRNNLNAYPLNANLHYRSDELPVKKQLEAVTGMEFTKERLRSGFVDFANDRYLIEHTVDTSRGVSEAIDRLNHSQDGRTKFLITHVRGLGARRLRKCRDITLIDVSDFWSGTFTLERHTAPNK